MPDAASSPPDLVERLRAVAVLFPQNDAGGLVGLTPEQATAGLEAMRGATPCPPHGYYREGACSPDSPWPFLRLSCDACWSSMLRAFLATAGANPKEG